MSSLMSSHGMALATATAMAVSGTVILMALCRPRPPQFERCDLRPCIASSAHRKNQKAKKRVRFGENVVVEFDDDDEDEEELVMGVSEIEMARNVDRKTREMPANRAALYSGIMQARCLQRMACY